MNKSGGNYYEFFAGGGMARAGLGPSWDCLFSNDFDHKKGRAYKENWGDKELLTADVKSLKTDQLPGQADLVWASFPCQDLSLAGGGAGLRGERSGTFWPFWQLVNKLEAENRAPKMIVLENVCGTLTSHKGKDFSAICTTLEKSGYNFGAVVIDAALFVPQSRPRLFVVAVKNTIELPTTVIDSGPSSLFHTKSLISAHEKLPSSLKKRWLWWKLESPATRTFNFSDLIEENPESVQWHSPEQTRKLLSMMSDVNLKKVEEAKQSGLKCVGAIYKRTRLDENGVKVQRAEVRFDNIAGCLRTPAGGSSRQLIMVVEGRKVRSRLISSREAARLMGLPDDYKLPVNYNEAYHLLGDGVVAPVVRHLAESIIEPITTINKRKRTRAAA